ncbi:MAG TPA: UvrD-helicase domain-containing protein [Burkholderiales bacterium]|nr:UvrD-helicase domain-containing protein [Burkholderiales bacterium]
MSEDRQHELTARALDPAASAVIEACAGSGKTWMLVSRIVRLLLAGASPSQILAITFTRKAAQEMATRLREWLFELATAPDDAVRRFLRDRGVAQSEVEPLLPKARQLYERYLTAQPQITIATFHSWFLQLLRRAPLDAGALGDVNLLEQTSSLVDEAWQLFATAAQRDRESPAARGLDVLFRDCGLDNTRRLLLKFLHRRADWWAYTQGQKDAVGYALARMREDMTVAPDADVIGPLLADEVLASEIAEYATFLSRNTKTDQEYARTLAGEATDAAGRFESLCSVVLKDDGAPRARKVSEAQEKRLGAHGEARFLELHANLGARLQAACGELNDQASYRFNEAALHCGVALLDAYQRVKGERQVIDYADIEWHAWALVSVSDHAVYMHCKLDARYRHVLLDEFQDTNPLQWLTLECWLAAAAAADSRPTVFMVGDPKQSIYRFRRADARLFGQAARYLEREFGARRLSQDESRRCPPPLIEVVNRLFGAEPAFEGFESHVAHYRDKRGRVEVLPLALGDSPPARGGVSRSDGVVGEPAALALRDPLREPLADPEDRRREREAEMLVEKLRVIIGNWRVVDDPVSRAMRPAEYRDVMILVRRRTHLAIYERALREARIPFVTSRQGGLLDTLEAQDIVALLEFLVSPFADLKLAHALRSPVFGCADEDLIALAAAGDGTWWERLQRIAAGACSAALKRAHELLARWLDRTDAAPVHDQIDRIYFEADVLRRYAQAVPAAMREAVGANLQAFMQRALDVDSGRYPSLPRFLHELMDLREAPVEEAPDEGMVGDAGNAVRIHTVHGAKGLEAPIVWLLDAAAGQDAGRGYDALVNWPPEARSPSRFSLWARKAEQSAAQRSIAESDEVLAGRENLNLLYVAMTRAQEALIVSGSEGRGRSGSWYEKVRRAVIAQGGGTASEDDMSVAVVHGDDLSRAKASGAKPDAKAAPRAAEAGQRVNARLSGPLPTGERLPVVTGPGARYGTQFHALMDRLTAGVPAERAAVQRELGLAERDFEPMWAQAQRILAAPELLRFFDPSQYKRASNEVSYMIETGEVRRIDRLVEFDEEMWVLDYKTGDATTADPALMEQYRAQLAEYCAAMRRLYARRRVNGAIVFADGPVFL